MPTVLGTHTQQHQAKLRARPKRCSASFAAWVLRAPACKAHQGAGCQSPRKWWQPSLTVEQASPGVAGRRLQREQLSDEANMGARQRQRLEWRWKCRVREHKCAACRNGLLQGQAGGGETLLPSNAWTPVVSGCEGLPPNSTSCRHLQSLMAITP